MFGYEAAHNQPNVAIDKKLAHNDGLFFVAIDQDASAANDGSDGKPAKIEVIGTIMAGYDGHRGWIYSVAVDPTFRRCGIGTHLVQHAEEVLSQLGCMKINLQISEGNESVAAFYTTLGYDIEKRLSMGKKIAENISNSNI